MTKRKGYFKIAKIGNTPILVHWSTPVGGVIISLADRAHPSHWLYYFIAFIFLIAIHEAGHFIAASAFGLKTSSVEIFGAGGLCRIEQPRKIWHGIFVYSAGLIAQFVLLVCTLSYFGPHDEPSGGFEKAVYFNFTFVNCLTFFGNLLPFKATTHLGTDGYVIWKYLRQAFKGRSRS